MRVLAGPRGRGGNGNLEPLHHIAILLLDACPVPGFHFGERGDPAAADTGDVWVCLSLTD